MSELEAVGIVGLGRMGQTLAAAFSRAVGAGRVLAGGRSAASIARFEQAVPGVRIASVRDLPDSAALIILCTPQTALPAVLDELRPRLTADHIMVTISNRQPLSALAEAVPGPVAKLIPSAGNEIGAGATLLVPGPGMTEPAIFRLLALTDLASCGPALLAAAAAAMAQAQCARTALLPPELAEELARRSLEAAGLLVGGGASLSEVIDCVAVPGGNTAAGLDAARDGLAAAWGAAFEATQANERSGPHHHPAEDGAAAPGRELGIPVVPG